ncbi:MAG: DUF554 domain-containing protein [Clostridia bacterium]|nr:DUF554 domain-containing protein [Clostridia bacterium]
MTGTLVNAAAVIVGGAIGLLFKSRIKAGFQSGVQKAIGVSIFCVGLAGLMANMLSQNADGTLASSGELLLIVSLVLGALAGELLKLDDRLNALGRKIEARFRMSGFTAGFVNASLLFCVGAMTIVGPLNEGLTGDGGILYIKSMLDFVSGMILASSLGAGVLCAAVPVLVIQGSISLCAGFLGPMLQSTVLLRQICMVGYALILSIGFNFVADSKIKIANLLPGLLVPIVWAIISSLV